MPNQMLTSTAMTGSTPLFPNSVNLLLLMALCLYYYIAHGLVPAWSVWGCFMLPYVPSISVQCVNMSPIDHVTHGHWTLLLHNRDHCYIISKQFHPYMVVVISLYKTRKLKDLLHSCLHRSSPSHLNPLQSYWNLSIHRYYVSIRLLLLVLIILANEVKLWRLELKPSWFGSDT